MSDKEKLDKLIEAVKTMNLDLRWLEQTSRDGKYEYVKHSALLTVAKALKEVQS